jgi:hypothetical protein
MLSQLCLLLTVLNIFISPNQSFDHAISNNNLRIFHPSFPLKLKDPVSLDEIQKLSAIREKLQFSSTSKIELPDNEMLKRLPVSA